eukprot:1905642-Rhodomonas_salina.2
MRGVSSRRVCAKQTSVKARMQRRGERRWREQGESSSRKEGRDAAGARERGLAPEPSFRRAHR